MDPLAVIGEIQSKVGHVLATSLIVLGLVIMFKLYRKKKPILFGAVMTFTGIVTLLLGAQLDSLSHKTKIYNELGGASVVGEAALL